MADNSSDWMSFAQRSRDEGGLGLQPHQAAGLVGNLQAESGQSLPPWGPTGDEGSAWGTAQWRGDRLEALKAHAAENGLDYRTVPAQQAFMRREFDGSENKSYKALQAATTPEEAATIVNTQYERSADRSGKRERAALKLSGSDPMAYADEETRPALSPQVPPGALQNGGTPIDATTPRWAQILQQVGQTMTEMAPGIAQDPDHAKVLEAAAASGRKVADAGTWSHITLPNGQIARINSKQGVPQVMDPKTGQWMAATGNYAKPEKPEKDPVQQAADIAKVKAGADLLTTLGQNGTDSRAALDAALPVRTALQNPDVPQGLAGELQHTKNKALLLVPGFDTPELRKTVADTETAKAGINKMVQEGRSLNGGMPGSLSDKDLVFLKESQAGLQNTPQGNQRILDIYKQLHDRRIEKDVLAQEYAASHPLGLDTGYHKMVADKWAAENKARDEKIKAAEAAQAATPQDLNMTTPNKVQWRRN